MENALPAHPFHHLDGPVVTVYIHPFQCIVSPMRLMQDKSTTLPYCNNDIVHPVKLFRVYNNLSFTAQEVNVLASDSISSWNRLSITTHSMNVLAPTGLFKSPVLACNGVYPCDCLSLTAQNTNVLTYENVSPCIFYNFFYFVTVSMSCMARIVIQSLTHLMVLISQSQYFMHICLYYHDLFRIVLLMYCIPQENPSVLAYITFMCAVRNMILKHDFLAHITC